MTRQAFLLCALVCGTVSASAQRSTAPAARAAAPSDVEWRVNHGNNKGQRYAPLDQISRDTVRDLKVVWRVRTDNFGPRPEYKSETTPIFANGLLYFTAGRTRNVVAVDPASGELVWMWRPTEGERANRAPRLFSGRGVAYANHGSGDERIYTVTPGFQLVALDAKSGLPVPNFGNDGSVDLMRLISDSPVDLIGTIGSSSPPVVANGVVMVGPAHVEGSRPRTKENTRGDVMAFDAKTGKSLWTYRSIPAAGQPGSETWEGDSLGFTGNAGVWAPFVVDEELGRVYLPVEAATSDYYGGHRLGDNLFTTSLVCLDIKTGQRVWFQQLVHHDIFDYDNPAAPILVDITVDGRPTKAVVQVTKQSWAYVFDRVTGAPVWPMDERPVPQTDVPGERTAKTQPHVSKPAPFDVQGVSEKDLIDFTPELHRQALELVKGYRIGPLFTPPTLAAAADGTKGLIHTPGSTGGAGWEGAAVDPEAGVLYIGSATLPTVIALAPNKPLSNLDFVSQGGPMPAPQGLRLLKPPYGRITAIDLNTGTHLWMQPNGNTPREVRNHPALAGVRVGRTGSPSKAGVLVTKSLVFAGEGWGGEPYFRAYDKRTGAIVWEAEMPGVQTGIPMTYLHQGKQYVVFSVGDQDGDHPAEIVALALAERPTDGRLSVAAGGATPPVGAADQAAGWEPLWDGASYAGFEVLGGAKWQIDGGVLTATAGGGPSYLRTVRTFANVEVAAEFLADPGADSGVLLRCSTSDQVQVNARSCYEVNLRDADPVYPTGSVVDVARTKEEKPSTAGRWSTLSVVVDGTHVVVVVDGRTVVDARDAKLASGAIALQSAGTGQVRFRNVRVRRL
ncbi:MAG: family 16 glycoside hydrolase [Vicinamibacterales bacterium]